MTSSALCHRIYTIKISASVIHGNKNQSFLSTESLSSQITYIDLFSSCKATLIVIVTDNTEKVVFFLKNSFKFSLSENFKMELPNSILF